MGARFYVKHTMPVYRTSTTLLINDTDERPVVDNSELLQGLGLPGGLKNLENQIMILESGSLIEKTLKELPFEISFYIKTLRNKLNAYIRTAGHDNIRRELYLFLKNTVVFNSLYG